MRKIFIVGAILLIAGCGGNSPVGSENGLTGRRYGLSERAQASHLGIEGNARYNSSRRTIEGTVRNTTNSTYRIYIHITLSNDVSLGNAKAMWLNPGQTKSFSYTMAGQGIIWYTFQIKTYP